jgi:beta-1,2-mannobiose phosphorylase / 1,2-beta-oligomannan phosphorylase
MKSRSYSFGLGVHSTGENVFLFYNAPDSRGPHLTVDMSPTGFDFVQFPGAPTITDSDGELLDSKLVSNFRISKLGREYFLLFRYGDGCKILSATSKDLLKWKVKGSMKVMVGGHSETVDQGGMVVSEFKYKGYRLLFYGENSIRVAVSKDMVSWNASKAPVLTPRPGSFDDGALSVATVYETNKGIVLIYYVTRDCSGDTSYSIGSALFDKKNPEKLLFRSEAALIEHVEGFEGKNVLPLGVVNTREMLISYWDVAEDGIVAVAHPVKRGAKKSESRLRLVLNKLKSNPILKPIAEHAWESKAVFNPAAIYENGKVHLIYRAVGENDVSVLGYATSDDGVNFDERLAEPIYVPRTDWEGLNAAPGGAGYLSPFFSGGAYGGCEDPRITKVEDKFYMTYVAYDGHRPPRVALTSIGCQDFFDRNWDKWKAPVLISPPGVVNKNACIFPEKINGKYVIFHRIYPHILVDYVDDLDFDGKTKFLEGHYSISPRAGYWDSRKVGVGAPPIKTDYGYLLIYQSVGEQDPGRYKMGAMLLDLQRPERVLFRTKQPLLAPDEWYENEGLKAGVAYPCGSVIKDGKLFVYYGGADTVICVAEADSEKFLYDMTHHEQAQLSMVKVLPKFG